jgi:DNA polymerase sigma
VTSHEQDFLAAFEQKMLVVQADMKHLKQQASLNRHKAKQEARTHKLQEERDWFRDECLTLTQQLKQAKSELAKAKTRQESEA